MSRLGKVHFQILASKSPQVSISVSKRRSLNNLLGLGVTLGGEGTEEFS